MRLHLLAYVLALIVSTVSADGGDEGPDPFNIAFQRYDMPNCVDPLGKREPQVGRRDHMLNNGYCHFWKKGWGGHFASFDYKWKPYDYYEADRAQDDPLLTTNKNATDGRSMI